jgi:hypothetical protein
LFTLCFETEAGLLADADIDRQDFGLVDGPAAAAEGGRRAVAVAASVAEETAFQVVEAVLAAVVQEVAGDETTRIFQQA